nr:MAG TPA: hypothetical protein [Caudoviricetes sp.]
MCMICSMRCFFLPTQGQVFLRLLFFNSYISLL